MKITAEETRRMEEGAARWAKFWAEKENRDVPRVGYTFLNRPSYDWDEQGRLTKNGVFFVSFVGCEGWPGNGCTGDGGGSAMDDRLGVFVTTYQWRR